MKVKICGLSTKAAVDTAVAGGADYLGFVFAESKRRIAPQQVRDITRDVPRSVKKVGVFVSPTLPELESMIVEAGLDLVQIHGEQPDGALSVPHIVARSAEQHLTMQELEQLPGDYLLFDAPSGPYAGGNGQTFDWERLDLTLLRAKKVFIAGGLTSQNVAQAKAFFQPYAVDVSSGVETNGVKDIEKIKEFLKKAKEDTPYINNQ